MRNQKIDFLIFINEFHNHLLISQPAVDYPGLEKFEEMDKWFDFSNLPESVIIEIKNRYKNTLYPELPKLPYFLQQPNEFFNTIPYALFNFEERINLNQLRSAIRSPDGFSSMQDVIYEEMGGHSEITEDEANHYPTEDENAFNLNNDENPYEVSIKLGTNIFSFLARFRETMADDLMRNLGHSSLISREFHNNLYGRINQIVQNEIIFNYQFSLNLYNINNFIRFPNWFPQIERVHDHTEQFSFSLEAIEQLSNIAEQVNQLEDRAIGVNSILSINFQYFDFKHDYSSQTDEAGFYCRPSYTIKSPLSSYHCETKKIELRQQEIACLSNLFKIPFEDFEKAIIYKNIGFWLTQDMNRYPTQWFLRLDYDYLKFYSNFFAFFFVENKNQEEALEIIALLENTVSKPYFNLRYESKINSHLVDIIDNLPSLYLRDIIDVERDFFSAELANKNVKPDEKKEEIIFANNYLSDILPIQLSIDNGCFTKRHPNEYNLDFID